VTCSASATAACLGTDHRNSEVFLARVQRGRRGQSRSQFGERRDSGWRRPGGPAAWVR